MAQQLEEYYQKLETMMIEGEALIAARDPITEREVKRRIADAALVMASYQLFVHREVFVPMFESADATRRQRINEIKVECIALTEDLRFSVRDFIANLGPLDWDLLGPHVAWFNDRVRKHIADVRALTSPSLTPAEQAALIARRIGTVGASL